MSTRGIYITSSITRTLGQQRRPPNEQRILQQHHELRDCVKPASVRLRIESDRKERAETYRVLNGNGKYLETNGRFLVILTKHVGTMGSQVFQICHCCKRAERATILIFRHVCLVPRHVTLW